ncbi:MAG TPA: nuclear transport factor 2 family protein [Usitatibacter sp.]|nr:nuclear transport factor 2 family protein [Usitatibacter sp.]
MGNKQAAVAFMQLASAGRVDEAYATYVAPNFRHHNPWFAAGTEALKKGMADNAREHPQKTFDVKRVIEEGDLVAVHAHVRMKPDHPGYALIHICRFEQGRIAELWEAGMEIPADAVNTDGVF